MDLIAVLDAPEHVVYANTNFFSVALLELELYYFECDRLRPKLEIRGMCRDSFITAGKYFCYQGVENLSKGVIIEYLKIGKQKIMKPFTLSNFSRNKGNFGTNTAVVPWIFLYFQK